MATDAPACPDCRSDVQPDWDWCHHCGYDPDGLRPQEAAVAAGSVPSQASAAAPMAMAPLTVNRGVATIDTLRDTSTLTPEPARGLGGLGKALGRDRKPKKKDQPRQPAAVAGRDLTLRVAPTSAMRGVSALLFVVTAFLAFATFTGVVDIAKSTGTLNRVTDVVFIMMCAVLTFVVGVQAAAIVRLRVVLTPTELVTYNRFGRVRRVARDQIRSIRMGEREYDVLGSTLSAPIDVPYLQQVDGDGFWLDALGARSPRTPPTEEQEKLLAKLVEAAGLAPLT
jgi:hypothetical protein